MPTLPREFQRVTLLHAHQFSAASSPICSSCCSGPSCSGQTHRHRCAAHRGPGPAARLAQVPPGPEPGQVERPRRQPPAAGPTRGRLSAGGSAGLRPGRNPGAPLGPRTAARGIYRVPCAAAAPPWSGAAACAGSASACSRPCPEPRGYGPLPVLTMLAP